MLSNPPTGLWPEGGVARIADRLSADQALLPKEQWTPVEWALLWLPAYHHQRIPERWAVYDCAQLRIRAGD